MSKKTPLGIVVEPEVAERIRNAAFWSSETVGGLLTQGAIEKIERMEAERGGPFPPREGEVKTGRPKKA